MSTQLHPSRTATTKDTGTPTIWLDGQWCDRATAMVSVYDHGLLYGDGVFEGIRVYGGKIFRLAEHLDRLDQGFLEAGLIHRVVVSRLPVLIGTGIPLFGPLSRDVRLEHVATRTFPSGLVQSEYRVIP